MITADQLMTQSLRDCSHGRRLAEIMASALHAVDPAVAVRQTVCRAGNVLLVNDRRFPLTGRVIVVGAGKAGAPMVEAAAAVLGDWVSVGLVIVKHGHLGTTGGQVGAITLVEGGHPIPNERGMAAAGRLAGLLAALHENDLVLVLLSGGGSALLTLPASDLTLADMQHLTTALLRCGATIGEINTLRKHCTQLGGGQLAQLAAPATVVALIVSDVVGSPLDVIASGPTVADPTTWADAWAIVERYQLESTLPAALLAHLRRGLAGDIAETPKFIAPDRVFNTIIASNAVAAEAALVAARERGFNALLLTTFLEGEARDIGQIITTLAREIAMRDQPLARPALLVAGGETTVTLHGAGLGGRNQELALGAVAGLAELPNTLVIALATDGGDGPTDAAGAVVTGDTLRRAQTLGLDPHDFLRRNDAYHFFAALDDLLRPGSTLTNVNDLLLIAVV